AVAVYAYYCNEESFRARPSSLLTKMGVVLLLALLAASGARRCLNGSEHWWPDLQHDGGTVLFYAVEEPSPPGQPYDREDLAALRRRLDPDGKQGVLVRLKGATQIEISIPHTSKDHGAYVNLIKDLIGDVGSGPGHLEFLILANDRNDKDAIEVAEQYFR